MNRVIVQVPMSKDLKEKAASVASDMGFSSLQEVIRILVSKLANCEFSLKIEEETITDLHPAAERRIKKAVADIKAGRNIYKPKDKEEFFKILNS